MKFRGKMLSIVTVMVVAAAGCAGSGDTTPEPGEAGEQTSLTMPVLAAPSLGFFLPPIIEAQELDAEFGLDVEFAQKPAGTYRTDFAGGSDQIGGSGTLYADVARVNQEEVDTVYVFNLFDFWGGVVVPEGSPVTSFDDLEGATVAAALPTANFAMFQGVLHDRGIDPDSLELQNTDVPGLAPTARSGRVDGVQLWEPAHTLLLMDESFEFTTLDVAEAWREATGVDELPYLGVAAHRDWAESNPDTIQAVYEMYKAAAEFVMANPTEAAEIIGTAIDVDPEAIEALIDSDRLGLNVYPASSGRDGVEAVLERAVATGYLDEMPNLDEILYDGLEE